MSFNDDEPIVPPPNSGPQSPLTAAGRVKLVTMGNGDAPLEEYRHKVMVELTGGESPVDRSGLDLVAVLDISGSMQGDKIDKMKSAMQFVIKKLSPRDRLSIVTFSTVAARLCPLRQVTEALQPQLLAIINNLKAGGNTNISDGLSTGLKVLADRKLSIDRDVGIMLMSDGQQNVGGDAAQIVIGKLPVYTFGFGADYDPKVLDAIAKNSPNGVFNIAAEADGLSMAFSQIMGGLLSVVAQDLQLTLLPVVGRSTIQEVSAGSYLKSPGPVPGSFTVKFGDLFSKEVRKVIVELLLPAVEVSRKFDILVVSFTFVSPGSPLFASPPRIVRVKRIGIPVREDDLPVLEVQTEEARLTTVSMIKAARTLADGKNLVDAQDKLVEAQNALEDVVEQSSPLVDMLRTELKQLLKLMNSQDLYEKQGRAYALSSVTSHDRQRFAARGDIEKLRLFATPRMDKYLEQAKRFDEDPTIPVPSVDEDVKEEVAANPLAPIVGPMAFYIQAAIQALQAIEQLINDVGNP